MATKTVEKSKQKTTNLKEVVDKKGSKYVVVGNGKVKKVNSFQGLSELDLSFLDSDYKKLTTDLYKYLREKDKETNSLASSTALKNGWCLFRKYKMRYSANGFDCIDVAGYGRTLKTPFKELPTAEEVYKFITSIGVDKTQIAKKKAEKQAIVNELLQKISKEVAPKNSANKLSIKVATALARSLKDDANISNDVKQEYLKKLQDKYPYLIPRETLSDEDLGALRKKALNICVRVKDINSVITRLTKLIPNRAFNIAFGKLVKKFKSRAVRAKTFLDSIKELLKNDEVFAEKLKPAPKFVPKEFFVADELYEDNGMVVFTNKEGTFKVSKTEFLLRDILSELSYFQAQIHKLLTKQITLEEFYKNPSVADKYVCLNYSLITGIKNDEALNDVLIDLLYDYETTSGLFFMYKNDISLNVGDKLRLYTPSEYKAYDVTVAKYDNGWRIRYEDGYVDYLFKGQQFKAIPPVKK